MSEVCFDCRNDGPLHKHHVVPQVHGGTATVLLCEGCHGKVHGHSMLTSELTRAALAERKSQGARLGRRCEDRSRSVALALEAEDLREQGLTFQAVADHFNERGEPTLRGGKAWRPSSIQKLFQLLELEREAAKNRAKGLNLG